MRTFSLLCFKVNFDAEGGADGQIEDGTPNGFVGCHSPLAVGTDHFSSTVSVEVYLDNFLRIGYFVDGESSETEECFEALNSQDTMLEIGTMIFLN